MSTMAAARRKGLLLADYRLSDHGVRKLEALGIPLLPSEGLQGLPEGLSGHPDLQAASLEGLLHCHQELGGALASALEELGAPYLRCPSRVHPPYPGHVAFNALISPTVFAHRLDATDPLLLAAARRRAAREGTAILPVRQGYSRCATAHVGGEHYVTEDPSMAKALRSRGKTVLHLPYGGVALQGFDHGFIGGVLSPLPLGDRFLVLLTGDPGCYPHGKELLDFLADSGAEAYPIQPGPFLDMGSILSHFWTDVM